MTLPLVLLNRRRIGGFFGGVWNDGYAWNDNTSWNDGA